MTLPEIRRRFPVAGSVLRRLVELDGVPIDSAESLSVYALERIEAGDTSERDALLLLRARAAAADRRTRR